jgi:hypothetical protein
MKMKSALVVALLAIGGLWLYSTLYPYSLGSCHEVPVSLGSEPTIRDCQAYSPTNFAVPLAVIAILALMSGEGDIKITLPMIGTFERTRVGKKAARVLKAETGTLDRRGEEFLRRVRTWQLDIPFEPPDPQGPDEPRR